MILSLFVLALAFVREHRTLAAVALGVGVLSITAPAIAPLIMILESFLARAWRFIYSIPFVTQEIGGDGEFALLGFLFTSVPFRNLGTERYSLERVFVRPLNEIMSIWYRSMDAHWRWARYRGAPVLFLPNGEGQMPRIIYLRGTVNFVELLKESASFHHEAIKARDGVRRRFKVVRYSAGAAEGRLSARGDGTKNAVPPPADGPVGLPTKIPVGWAVEEIGLSMEGAHLADLSLTPEMEHVIRDVHFWYSKEEWYRERGISWRRGYGLIGPPGCGKTSIVRALAEELDLPVCQFDLSGMDNHTFGEAWGRSRQNGSRIVLFEDFDTVFKGRQNVSQSKEGGLTFDTVLNSLDGIEREDGLLLFVTTNHPEDIDPALGVPDGVTGRSTRPGRIDVTVSFRPLEHAGRVKIALRILRDEALAERLAREGAEDSPAQLTERCVAFAMDALERERASATAAPDAPVDLRSGSALRTKVDEEPPLVPVGPRSGYVTGAGRSVG